MTNCCKSRKLGDICNIVGGGTPAKDIAEFFAGEIPWATVRDMRDEVIATTEFKITQDAVKSSATNIIPAGNVVIATRVGLGKVSIVDQDTAINQDLRGIIPNSPDLLASRYLFWWFKSIAHRIQEQGTGATVQGVKLPFVKELEIPLACLGEQQRIVSILDEAFAAISTAKANGEKNLQNVRALFECQLQAMFGQHDIGWTRKTLREVSIDFGRGRSRHRPRNDPKLYGGKYPFIQTGDVRNSNHLITAYSQTYNEIGLAQGKLWPAGTLCITIAANIAETGILGFDACFPDSVIGIVADEAQTSNHYLEYMLQCVKTQLKAQGKGSAQDNINLGTFETQHFPFPVLEEQAAIVSTLNSLQLENQRLQSIYQRKLAALDELKKSLLHRAFNGEL